MRLGDFLRIDLDDFGSVFVVYEDASFAIHRGEFGFAAERQGARNRAVRRIDGRGIFSAAIKREQDRKSTRLNSSHTVVSYAVFCLKKKRVDRCLDLHVSQRGSG